MVGGVRTGGMTAVLLIFAVVLATAAMPLLSGHTPLQAVGPDGSLDTDGFDVEADEFGSAASPQDGDSVDRTDGAGSPDGLEAVDSPDDFGGDAGLMHEDVAALADNSESAETMMQVAGLLALLFGEDGLGGAVGEPTELAEADADADDIDEADVDEEDVDADDVDADDIDEDDVDADDIDADDIDEDDIDADDVDADDIDEDDIDADDVDVDDIDEDDIDADDVDVDDIDEDDIDADDVDEADIDEDDIDADDVDEADIDEDDVDADDVGEADVDPDSETEEDQREADPDDQSDNDHSDSESDDDAAADSETDAGGENGDSLVDRLDPATIGLLVAGLLAIVAGWFAYRTDRSPLQFLRSIPTLLVDAVTRFVFGITAIVERAIQAVRAASSVFALPGLFVAGIVQSGRDLAVAVGSLFDRGQPTAAAEDTTQLPSEREQIRAAWRSVIDAVGERQYRRRTPGEIKRKALSNGLPKPPVSTLVGVFRDVEYGDKDSTDRAASAVSAAEELRMAVADADSGEKAGDQTDSETTDGESTPRREEPK